jgi:hypothetical protein
MLTVTNEIRPILEELKALVDASHATSPEAWIAGKTMTLHPPASADSIRKFFSSDIGLGYPKSYGEFLAASNGVEWMWRGLHFTPADPKRQKWVINESVDQISRFDSRFCRIQGDPTDENIREWKSKGMLYLPMSTIAAIGPVGDMLVYDHYSQDKNGEMAIGWKPSTNPKVEQWQPNIHVWLKTCLEMLRLQSSPSPLGVPESQRTGKSNVAKKTRGGGGGGRGK